MLVLDLSKPVDYIRSLFYSSQLTKYSFVDWIKIIMNLRSSDTTLY